MSFPARRFYPRSARAIAGTGATTALTTHDLRHRLRSAASVHAGERFPGALRALPAPARRPLLVLYDYAEFLDDLSDEALRSVDLLRALDDVESQVRDLYAGRPLAPTPVAELSPVVATCRLPMEPLLRLIEARRTDHHTTRYDTFGQLVEYCTLSANPVGELVLHVFGEPTVEQVALSDRLCTGLQLIERLQHTAQDHRRGRVYLPVEDLDRFGVAESDLDAPSAGPALRALAEFQSERAAAWLEGGVPLVSTLRGWGRLWAGACIASGRATLAALARAGYDPLAAPMAGGWQVLGQWLAGSVKSAG
jgi:squalene synthase HpnC